MKNENDIKKTVLFELNKFVYIGECVCSFFGGGNGKIDMNQFSSKHLLKKDEIGRMLNDHEFGSQQMLSATVEVFAVYSAVGYEDSLHPIGTIKFNNTECVNAKLGI